VSRDGTGKRKFPEKKKYFPQLGVVAEEKGFIGTLGGTSRQKCGYQVTSREKEGGERGTIQIIFIFCCS